MSTEFLILGWGLCNPGLTSCGVLFLLSFPTWAVWMEHLYPLTPRVSESWTLYWVESGYAFNICWKSETPHSTRAYKKLSSSSLAQAAEELTTPFLCGFSISGWLSAQTHLYSSELVLSHEYWYHYGHQGHCALRAWDWWSGVLLNNLSHALDPLIWVPPSWIWKQIVWWMPNLFALKLRFQAFSAAPSGILCAN